MIERYTRPEMGRIWSEQFRFETWLKVEIAACVAHNLTLTCQVIASNNVLAALKKVERRRMARDRRECTVPRLHFVNDAISVQLML